MEKSDLIAFEADIASLFEQAKIPYPCHLDGGNEDALVEIFQDIRTTDWVFATHRSHYKALLHGVPPELVKEEILKGHSISLNFAEYRFFSSAIVGGVLPIAVGVAMTGQTCWVFCGEMAAETGIFHECIKFALGHELPIHFVVEDNGYSVLTPTAQVWRYSYERTFPHQGVGTWVIF